jgi:GT2 family glycosyltransferase
MDRDRAQKVTRTVPVTVVIPTIGRERLLTECLRSLAATDPRPREVLIVDQSGVGSAGRLVQGFDLDSRVIEVEARGISRALNTAMHQAAHDLLLVTHDDCRVREDWIGVAHELLAARPDVLFTGRVLPEGGSQGVPSTITRLAAREYRAEARCNVLYPNNMAVSARRAIAMGGFDERFTVAAEDNDFCYRWLMSGQAVRYEPRMVVWHRDWRSPDELRRLYRRYWSAQGEMYAKHLSRRDLRLVPSLVANLRSGVIGAARRRFGRNRHVLTAPDFSYGALTHLPLGLLRGLRSRPVPPSESGTPAA